MDDPYSQALLAYVFGLAGLWEQQQVQRLAQHSISAGTAQAGHCGQCPHWEGPQPSLQHRLSCSPSPTDGQLYWKRKGQAQKALELSWAAAALAEVEMTAYVLLAYLSQPSVSPADLGTASQIVCWLCKQQNPYGGFASTQVPALGSRGCSKLALPGRCAQG